MPGTNLIASSDALSEIVVQQFRDVQQAMLHFPGYAAQTIVADDRVLIGATARPSYPRRVVSMPEGDVLLEGMIYNRSVAELEASLQDLLLCSSQENLLGGRLRRFIRASDGDFVVVLYNRNHRRLSVANDSLGRLPAFYSLSGNRFLFSREPKFIAPFLSRLRFNRHGLLAYLMFGFTYDKDTLIDGVHQLRPGTILTYDCQQGNLNEEVTALYSTEDGQWTDRANVIQVMKDTFLESVRCRVEQVADRELVVSLSGGLDSRAVLAGALACRSATRAVTIECPELAHARAMATALRVPLNIISNGVAHNGKETPSKVFLKDGLDSMEAQASFHYFLEQLTYLYGDTVSYWTGTYGGELTRFLHLTSGMSSLEDLTAYLLNAGEEYKWSTVKATRMLGASVDEAREALRSYLSRLPETTPSGKYVRFRHEFDRKYTGNAEDRNRFYVWTITPFVGLDFIKHVSSLDENRKNTRLFRDFLSALDVRTCSCPYYNLNLDLNDHFRLRALAVVERAARSAVLKKSLLRLNKLGKFLRRHQFEAGSLKSDVVMLLKERHSAQDYFDVGETLAILREEDSTKALSRMHTLLTYIEWLQTFYKRLAI